MTNKSNHVLYTGVTSNLQQRVKQHIEKYYPSCFTAKYNCDKLVWFETFAQISEAIVKEKQIKGGNRQAKINLITILNPAWENLWENDVQHW
jgi:putative endonuclease